MKNNYLKPFHGYVRIWVDGQYPERFLNRCIKEKLTIWGIERLGQERLAFYIALADTKKIRPFLRDTDCRVSFKERRGMPFFIKKNGQAFRVYCRNCCFLHHRVYFIKYGLEHRCRGCFSSS